MKFHCSAIIFSFAIASVMTVPANIPRDGLLANLTINPSAMVSADPMSGAIAYANITITGSEDIKAQILPTSGSDKTNAAAIALPIAIICALGLI